jgi:hypothetical protein
MRRTIGVGVTVNPGVGAKLDKAKSDHDALKARMDALTDGTNVFIGGYKLRVNGSNDLIAEKPDTTTVILVAHP